MVTLARNISEVLAWLIECFFTEVPRETLEFTLLAVRKAVLENKQS
jgi:hypothetical protein